MNHLQAYKLLRDNGFKISIGSGRCSEGQVSVTAFTSTDEAGRHCGVVARVEAENIQNGLVDAARRVNQHISVIRECAAFAGEEEFAGWAYV